MHPFPRIHLSIMIALYVSQPYSTIIVTVLDITLATVRTYRRHVDYRA